MTLKTAALSQLRPPKENPRHVVDMAGIEGLAESIKIDGVLQNLVVEPDEGGALRVVSGKRRFLALKLLKRKKLIDDDFKVPVEIRRDLTEEEALRIATVENVQREPLNPMDEAEAFAQLLQKGAEIADVAAKTGLSQQTVRRRLALASLCDDAKRQIRANKLPLGIAEAMTLGSVDQQRSILKSYEDDADDLNPESIRQMLLGERPSVAMAIFPLERYVGATTSDLFADEETTYFDDIDQFFTLQKEAVDALAEKHRKKGAFVDVLNAYAVPWWQYREAQKSEASGVVINLSPSGRVDVKKGLVKHEVTPTAAAETTDTPEAPKARRALTAGLIRSVALEKSIAVQAALLLNPRKAKQVAAVEILLGVQDRGPLKVPLHPCVAAYSAAEEKPKAFAPIRAEARHLLRRLGGNDNGTDTLPLCESDKSPVELYAFIAKLSDEELDRLIVLLVLLSFGQSDIDDIDGDEKSLFNHVANDLGVAMRDWWTPDATFLSHLKREQLETVALQSGAAHRLGKLKDAGKKDDLVQALARHFARTVDAAAGADADDRKGRLWQPGLMAFPAEETTSVAKGE